MQGQSLPSILIKNVAAWPETKWGNQGAWTMVKEEPPAQARGSNDCNAAVAYSITLLGQNKPIEYDPKLLPALQK